MISTAIVYITETLLIMNIITMIMAKGGGGRKHIVWRSKGSGGSCAGGLSGRKNIAIDAKWFAIKTKQGKVQRRPEERTIAKYVCCYIISFRTRMPSS